MNKTNRIMQICMLFIISLLLQSCSGGGFHLRESASLSAPYSKISLIGLSEESDFYKTLDKAINDAGGKVLPPGDSGSSIVFSGFKEDKQVVAYTSEREARIYLVYLELDYTLRVGSKELNTNPLRVEKTMIYDSSVVLGKAEEERRILQALREEAARLILLRLKYSKQ